MSSGDSARVRNDMQTLCKRLSSLGILREVAFVVKTIPEKSQRVFCACDKRTVFKVKLC